MANTPKLLAETTLASGSNTVYTAPASTTGVLNHISLTNTSVAAVTVDILAGTAASPKTWRDGIVLGANGGHVEFNGAFILSTTQILRMDASAGSAVDVVVSGLEVT